MRLVVLFLFFSSTVTAQDISKIDSGIIKGAAYKIIFPKNWKGKLVMYAHGYEFMGSLPRQSNNPQFADNMKPFLERGFAVAASDYSIQGFALPEGVENTEALRKYFFKKYGKPDTTFIVGHSMGGGITLLLSKILEKIIMEACRFVRFQAVHTCNAEKNLIYTHHLMLCSRA